MAQVAQEAEAAEWRYGFDRGLRQDLSLGKWPDQADDESGNLL